MTVDSSAQTLSILYTGAFRFPDGDAAAFRVQAVAGVFSALGHRVDFAGWEAGDAGLPYTVDGQRCFPQAEFRSGELALLPRLAGFFLRGRRTLAWLRTRRPYDVVVVYNPPALFAARLWLYGKVQRVKVVLDSTEWYDSRHLPGGRLGPAAWENWMRMQVSYRLFGNVIAISTFLAQHAGARNIVRIPPLLAVGDECAPARAPLSEGIRILYAGEAGRKDSLAQFIVALPGLEKALGVSVELHIAGMDGAALRDLLSGQGVRQPAGAAVRCYGRVTRAAVMDLYASCHFSVLFREERRYAYAGFPTKAVESWTHGCPLITNAVGDLRGIAQHMGNAIIVAEDRLVQDLPALLREVLSEGRHEAMARASSATGRRHFAPQAYAHVVKRFLTLLKN